MRHKIHSPFDKYSFNSSLKVDFQGSRVTSDGGLVLVRELDESWKTLRRVVAKVEFHCGELFPRVGFIVTSLAASSRAVVRFYNKRGTAEQWIKQGKQAVKMTRLSCHRFRSNEGGCG